jgi:hypothetical protein
MIWDKLGFKNDIFFINALRPVKEDIDFFIGRTDEIKKFIIDVHNSNRSLKIVSGKIGVGKTTFVNACQYYSYSQELPYKTSLGPKKLLVCPEKMQISETDSINDIITKTLISIVLSIRDHFSETNKKPSKELSQIIQFLVDVKIIQSGAGFQLGASILGTGGNIGFNTGVTVKNDPMTLLPVIKNLVQIIKSELGFDGIHAIMNNLELLSKTKIVTIFSELRDILFNIPDIYWVCIGHEGLTSIIETEIPRVADYLSGTESKIDVMEIGQVLKVISKRVQVLQKTPSAVNPVSDEMVGIVHFLSLMELRNTFKICSEIVKKAYIANEKITSINNEDAIKYLTQFSHERAKDIDLNPRQVSIIQALFQTKSCRPRDYATFGYEYSSGFISALQGMVKKQLLQVEQKGKARIYYATGMTMLAGLTGALGPDIQKIASQRITDGLKGKIKTTDKHSQYLLFTDE